MSLGVCETKKHYDSEWDAQLAANKVEEKFGDEMVPYQCWPLGHWHLTHKNRDKRRGAGHGFKRCDNCGYIGKEAKMYKHKCQR